MIFYPSSLARLMIRAYRFFISPYLGPNCRFIPTCSTYALEAFNLGFVRGIFLSIKRLLKCHPFHEGGFDPVPTCQNKTQLKKS
jgi:putative membrane protein insertion efficiency factor